MNWLRPLKFILYGMFVVTLGANMSYAQDLSALGLPALTTATGENGETTYSLSLQILLLMTALTVLPSLVLGMTAFTRIIIVLSILRQALGTQQTPPNQVLIAIALFLSFYIMSPIFEVLYANNSVRGRKSIWIQDDDFMDLDTYFRICDDNATVLAKDLKPESPRSNS